MDITIPKPDESAVQPPKRRHMYGCCLIIFIFILIISGIAFYFRSYLAVIPTLLQATQKQVPRTKTEQGLTYTYNGPQYLNILLLGSDNDAKFNPSNVLTQTIIIVSLNTKTNQVNMISIPRDFWVPIDGVSGGYGKIDQASGFGGIALTRQTIEKDFGVHIDYYAWVGLQGFVKVIDTFGGIDIDVNHPVLDDVYPNDISGNDPYSAIRLYIPAGPQHLSGIHALEYVRSRHGDLQGDFGRSARQQQVLFQLKKVIENSNVISKIPQLANELQGSVVTDMSIIQLSQLAPLLTSIKTEDIHRYILSPPTYSSDGLSPDGKQDIVKPDMTKIKVLFDQIFTH